MTSRGRRAADQPVEIVSDPEVDARRKERAIEWGTWECGEESIYYNGARGYNEGDPVPVQVAKRLGLEEKGAIVPAGTYAKKVEAAEAAQGGNG